MQDFTKISAKTIALTPPFFDSVFQFSITKEFLKISGPNSLKKEFKIAGLNSSEVGPGGIGVSAVRGFNGPDVIVRFRSAGKIDMEFKIHPNKGIFCLSPDTKYKVVEAAPSISVYE